MAVLVMRGDKLSRLETTVPLGYLVIADWYRPHSYDLESCVAHGQIFSLCVASISWIWRTACSIFQDTQLNSNALDVLAERAGPQMRDGFEHPPLVKCRKRMVEVASISESNR